MPDRLPANVPIWFRLWVAGLGCGLVGATACGDDSEAAAGTIVWEQSLEYERTEPRRCLYLTVERDSDAVVVLGDARLRAFDAATGHQRWSHELLDCQQVWDDAPGIGSVRLRYDNNGRELERFSSQLGLVATQDSDGHPIALGTELVKLDRDRTPLWEQRLAFELGSPRASSVLVDEANNVIISWAGGECASANVLRKYDADGALQWSSCLELQHGGGGVPIAIDGSEILVAGVASGTPRSDGGARQWLVQRYDAAGERVWSRPLATLITSRDGSEDITNSALSAMGVDSDGNIYVVGRVLGRKPEVSLDVFITKLDREAHELWTRIVAGKPRLDDQAVAIAIDARDQPYVLARMDHPARESLATPPARLWLGKLTP